jgi:hypothetical protein
MTLITFLIATPIVILLAAVIRTYWKELLVIWLVLRLIFYIACSSLTTAFMWYLFFGDNDKWEGFGLLWLFHIIIWSSMVGAYLCILLDIFSYATGFIRYMLKTQLIRSILRIK